MNGLCIALEVPRSLPTDWRPGRSGLVMTWFSRAHAPLSWTSSQRASGRSSVALITPVSRTAAAPLLRIRVLRATTGRSPKTVYDSSTARPLRSSASTISSVSASSSDST